MCRPFHGALAPCLPVICSFSDLQVGLVWQDERQSEVPKSGSRSGPSRAPPGPPRVTGWDAPARPPPNLGTPLRSPAGPSRGGLASALQSQSSPTLGQDQARGSETQAAVRRGQAVNANFLLNFKYEEHKRQPAGRPLPPRRRRERLKPYNKELFLQANFRFLVSARVAGFRSSSRSKRVWFLHPTYWRGSITGAKSNNSKQASVSGSPHGAILMGSASIARLLVSGYPGYLPSECTLAVWISC